MMAETITLIKGKGYREVESQIDWEKINRALTLSILWSASFLFGMGTTLYILLQITH